MEYNACCHFIVMLLILLNEIETEMEMEMGDAEVVLVA